MQEKEGVAGMVNMTAIKAVGNEGGGGDGMSEHQNFSLAMCCSASCALVICGMQQSQF
jgi:hypothetical protein